MATTTTATPNRAQQMILDSVPIYSSATVTEVRDHMRLPRTLAARMGVLQGLNALRNMGLVTTSVVDGAVVYRRPQP